MKKNVLINKMTEWLDLKKTHYHIGNNQEIYVSSIIKKDQEKRDEDDKLMFFALWIVEDQSNKVFHHERIVHNNQNVIDQYDENQTSLQTEETESALTIGLIISMLISIAASSGYSIEKLDDESIKDHVIISPSSCPICNHPHSVDTEVCSICGYRIPAISSNNQAPIVPIGGSSFKGMLVTLKKMKYIPLIFISMILILIVMVGIALDSNNNVEPGPTGGQTYSVIFKDFDGSILSTQTIPKGNDAIAPTDPIRDGYVFIGWDVDFTGVNGDLIVTALYSIDTTSSDSSVVSDGVDKYDLGNIMNGQYYFASDEYIFYSSFDTNDEAHIYRADRDGTNLTPIFDGFGWSLVVIGDWLYFSGNQGVHIDGTYNLFRMRFDGSQLENINNKYSYGMFVYDNYLYFMESFNTANTQMSIYRANLDGSNKQMLVAEGYSPLIHNHSLYYIDGSRTLYKADPDGSNREIIVDANVNFYVISGDLIVYIKDNKVQTCQLDGTNNRVIISATGNLLYNLNVYNNHVFYTDYDFNFDYTYMGYHYNVYNSNLDGSDINLVFSSISYGIYINIVNDQLMLMDYAQLAPMTAMVAIIKVMNLDGSGQYIMDR